MSRFVSLVLILSFVPILPAAENLPSFRLRDTQGKVWSADDLKDAKAIAFVFLGTQCPINNAYVPRLIDLADQFGKRGVVFLGVNANEHETKEAILEHVRQFKIPFPILRDEGQRLADKLGAQRTPEVVVLDAKGEVRYQGRIDDRFGIGFQRPAATQNDLADALEAIVSGKDVARPKVAVAGCIITRAPRPKGGASVTYASDVSRIIQNRCLECHRPGQIGPMPLQTYDDVASWSAMLKEVIEEKRMPPWHADPRFGKFHNDRSLPEKERTTLLAWIDQGCPKGDDKDLPASRSYPEGWTIGTPDAIFEMPRVFQVPAKAPAKGVPYQHFTVQTNFKEDVWIQAAEAKPGNRAVVHHIIVYVLDGKKRAGAPNNTDGIGRGMLVAYAPGDYGAVYPANSAKKVPKGATLVFQMHYTPNGVAQGDRSSLGLVFAKAPPEHEVLTRGIAQQYLMIWPGRDNQRAVSASTFKEDVVVWNLMPHMHLRGKSFRYEAVTPDGKRETLLVVPKYDFAWQASYRLAQPLELPAGSRIECTAHYDNSTNNPNNPDPTKMVRWGDQTWEEMMIGFVDYSVVRKK